MTFMLTLMIFTANSADYGGAIHVDDDTNSGNVLPTQRQNASFKYLLSIEKVHFTGHKV